MKCLFCVLILFCSQLYGQNGKIQLWEIKHDKEKAWKYFMQGDFDKSLETYNLIDSLALTLDYKNDNRVMSTLIGILTGKLILYKRLVAVEKDLLINNKIVGLLDRLIPLIKNYINSPYIPISEAGNWVENLNMYIQYKIDALEALGRYDEANILKLDLDPK